MSSASGPPRGPHLRRFVAIGTAAAALVALTGCSSSEPTESATRCLSPRLTIVTEPAEEALTIAPVGSLMSVTGERFADGCFLADGDPTALEPLGAVRLFVQQGSESISVAQVSPSADFDFTVEFGLPESLTPGPARVVATSSSAPDPEDEILSGIEFEVGGS